MLKEGRVSVTSKGFVLVCIDNLAVLIITVSHVQVLSVSIEHCRSIVL